MPREMQHILAPLCVKKVRWLRSPGNKNPLPIYETWEGSWKPEIEAVLRAYAARYPEDEASVERALEFRRRVGEEFERLVEGTSL